MDQHLQTCDLRIKLQRLEEPGCMSYSECLFVTCMGTLTVTLGTLVIVYGFSGAMALCIGITMMALGSFLTLLSCTLALCTASQNVQRAVRQRLEEAERDGQPRDWTEPSVTASTFL
ncbi:hypothetical protein GHT09_015742 [Marmota monax]|uniref:Uncharacterized protein n=1 Tax=Marmota monax TaxID=9995 RepID=A0A834PL35_MARMO|nr:hypothetical protein GHT09_015742 [Marmota monax]